MTNYQEREADRAITLVPNGDGTWSPTSGNDDPYVTLVRRFGAADTASATSVSSGTTTIHTPAAGKAVRLKWIALSGPAAGQETLVTVKLGDTTAYLWSLSAPGAFMRTSIREGAADAVLTVTLSVATTVYVNYELEEFTP